MFGWIYCSYRPTFVIGLMYRSNSDFKNAWRFYPAPSHTLMVWCLNREIILLLLRNVFVYFQLLFEVYTIIVFS
jgi:hypothetical protein